MKIAKINRKKNRVEIILEDNSKLDLPLGLAAKYSFSEEEELTEETAGEIAQKSEYIKAKDSAYRILGRRAHSVFELKRKLRLKEYSNTVINRILSELINLDYLDDEKYALEFYRNRSVNRKDGHNKIVAQLKQRGIDKGIIEKTSRLQNDDPIHLENALVLANKKLESIKKKTEDRYKLRAKLSIYLQNKGFSFDIIRKVLADLNL